MPQVEDPQLRQSRDAGGYGREQIFGEVEHLKLGELPEPAGDRGQQVLADPQIAEARRPDKMFGQDRELIPAHVETLQ